MKEGVAAGEHAPQRAALTGGAPAGLVHVHALTGAHTLSELLVGLRQRLAGALEDRLDGAGAQAHPEQLFAELHNITAADAVAHRQHRHSRFKTRAEHTAGDIRGQQRPRPLATAGAAHPRTAMLDHPSRDNRQLFYLMAHQLTHAEQLRRHENVAALAALRPVLDDLIHRAQRQQLAAMAIMPQLGTPRSPRADPFLAQAMTRPADPSSAAAKSYASSSRARAPASPPAPPAAGYDDPSPATPRLQPHAPRHRPPPPQRAPHPRIRRSRVMSPHQLNAY